MIVSAFDQKHSLTSLSRSLSLRGDWTLVGICYPSDTTFQVMADTNDRQGNSFDDISDYGTVGSLAELERAPLDRKYFFDRGAG